MPKQDVADGIPYVKVKDFPTGEIDVGALHRTAPDIAAKYARSTLRSGDVLVSIRGTYGRSAIVPDALTGGNITQDTARISPASGVDSRYLVYFLRSPRAQQYFKRAARGVAVKGVNIGDLRELPAWVAPQREQFRIVAAIEEHASRLDAAERSLVQAHRRLAILRAATLAAAVGEHDPVALGALVTELRYGTSIKCSYEGEGPPVLRIPNVRAGNIDLSDVKFAIRGDVDLSSVSLQKEDLLFVRTNGSRDLIGRVASVDEAEGMAFASYLIRARPDRSRLYSRFAVIALSTPASRAVIESKAATTAGQYNLNLAALRSLPVPLPPIEEQRSITSEVERQLSIVDAMDAEIDRALRRSAALRRSILEQAFSGRLVPQDPTDEPASLLLERIAAERAKAEEANGRRPRRRATIHKR